MPLGFALPVAAFLFAFSAGVRPFAFCGGPAPQFAPAPGQKVSSFKKAEISPMCVCAAVLLGTRVVMRTRLYGQLRRTRAIALDEEIETHVFSPQSPLGGAVLGAAKGDKVSYKAPNGRNIEVTILDVAPFEG